MTNKHETVADILAEIIKVCGDAISRRVKMDDTFFFDMKAARQLEKACKAGDISMVLHELQEAILDGSDEEYIERLEAAMSRDRAAMEIDTKSKAGTVPAIEADDTDDEKEDNASEPADEPPHSKSQAIPQKSHAPTVPVPQPTVPKAATPVKSNKPKQAKTTPVPDPAKAKTADTIKPPKLGHRARPTATPPPLPKMRKAPKPNKKGTSEIPPAKTQDNLVIPFKAQLSEDGNADVSKPVVNGAVPPAENKQRPVASVPRAVQAGEYLIVPITQLEPHPLAKDFFQRDDATFGTIRESIKVNGFDPGHPLTVIRVGKDRYQVVEGQTRFAAAQGVVKVVPIVVVAFRSEAEMTEYIVRSELFRRKLSDSILLKAAEVLIPIEEERATHRRGRKSGEKNNASHEAEFFSSSSKAVGLLLDRSKSSIDRIKRVLLDPGMKAAVLKGEIGISAAYRQLTALDKKSASPDDETGDDTGELADLATREICRIPTIPISPPAVVKAKAGRVRLMGQCLKISHPWNQYSRRRMRQNTLNRKDFTASLRQRWSFS